ncbi:dual specificity protein phosphatase [Microbacterium sp. X-17]|uniref:protein-tyrosine phosphatase family protein n=1 Tax=Microbacterium sp. X-17 TaxID=3144404 RepID=UPI0031F540AC
MNTRMELADACQLTDSLWVGGQLDRTDPVLAHRQLDELSAAGIDSIIDCRYEADDVDWITAAKPQIDYLHIGVQDAGLRMPEDWFDVGTDYALEQIKNGHVVHVHCQAGINRGPSMAFAILIAQGWDAVEALDHIRSVRQIARIGYAEDAVVWLAAKVGGSVSDRSSQMNRVRAWRAANQLPRRSDKRAYGNPT